MPASSELLYSGTEILDRVVAYIAGLEPTAAMLWLGTVVDSANDGELSDLIAEYIQGDISITELYHQSSLLEYDTAGIEQLLIEAFHGGHTVTAGAVGLSDIEMAIDFSAENPEVLAAFDAIQMNLVGVTQATNNGVLAVIQEAIDASWRKERLAREIRAQVGLLPAHVQAVNRYHDTLVLGGTTPARATQLSNGYAGRLRTYRGNMIARTEVAQAVSRGQLTFWRGMQTKGWLPQRTQRIWITAQDELVCPVCGPMQGVPVDLGSPWLLDNGKQVLVPPESHPHCRCTTGLIFHDELGKVDKWQPNLHLPLVAALSATAELSKSKSTNTQGNPWHSNETGRFTSADELYLAGVEARIAEYGNTSLRMDELVQEYQQLAASAPREAVSILDALVISDRDTVARLSELEAEYVAARAQLNTTAVVLGELISETEEYPGQELTAVPEARAKARRAIDAFVEAQLGGREELHSVKRSLGFASVAEMLEAGHGSNRGVGIIALGHLRSMKKQHIYENQREGGGSAGYDVRANVELARVLAEAIPTGSYIDAVNDTSGNSIPLDSAAEVIGALYHHRDTSVEQKLLSSPEVTLKQVYANLITRAVRGLSSEHGEVTSVDLSQHPTRSEAADVGRTLSGTSQIVDTLAASSKFLNTMAESNWLSSGNFAADDFRSALKMSIVDRLSERIGKIGYSAYRNDLSRTKQLADKLIRGWASSSASFQSQALQWWASEFTGDPSSWDGFAQRQGALADPIADFNRNNGVVSDSTFVQAFGQAVYEETQALLNGAGIDTLLASRGTHLKWDDSISLMPNQAAVEVLAEITDIYDQNLKTNNKNSYYHDTFSVDVKADALDRQPLSSWSIDFDTASEFAYGGWGGTGYVAAIQTARIPSAAIWSTALTGPGASIESEVIAFDTPGTAAVQFDITAPTGYDWTWQDTQRLDELVAQTNAQEARDLIAATRAPRDGDGDGKVFDGTDQEQAAVAKASGLSAMDQLLNWLPPETPWWEDDELAKSKSANTQGNPWHSDETGRFTGPESPLSIADAANWHPLSADQPHRFSMAGEAGEWDSQGRFDWGKLYSDKWAYYQGSSDLRAVSARLMGLNNAVTHENVDPVLYRSHVDIEQSASMLRAIAADPSTLRNGDEPLYRGLANLREGGGYTDRWPGSPILRLRPGDSWTAPLSAWTNGYKVAENHARPDPGFEAEGTYDSLFDRGPQPDVIFKLVGPHRALKSPTEIYPSERISEYVTQGAFEVVSHERNSWDDAAQEHGTLHTITIRQTHVFDPVSGWLPIDGDGDGKVLDGTSQERSVSKAFAPPAEMPEWVWELLSGSMERPAGAVEKFNANHDELGRFASADSGVVANPDDYDPRPYLGAVDGHEIRRRSARAGVFYLWAGHHNIGPILDEFDKQGAGGAVEETAHSQAAAHIRLSLAQADGMAKERYPFYRGTAESVLPKVGDTVSMKPRSWGGSAGDAARFAGWASQYGEEHEVLYKIEPKDRKQFIVMDPSRWQEGTLREAVGGGEFKVVDIQPWGSSEVTVITVEQTSPAVPSTPAFVPPPLPEYLRAFVAKFNTYHDELGIFATAEGGDIAKSKSANTSGNPWHNDETGRFTSADEGGGRDAIGQVTQIFGPDLALQLLDSGKAVSGSEFMDLYAHAVSKAEDVDSKIALLGALAAKDTAELDKVLGLQVLSPADLITLKALTRRGLKFRHRIHNAAKTIELVDDAELEAIAKEVMDAGDYETIVSDYKAVHTDERQAEIEASPFRQLIEAEQTSLADELRYQIVAAISRATVERSKSLDRVSRVIEVQTRLQEFQASHSVTTAKEIAALNSDAKLGAVEDVLTLFKIESLAGNYPVKSYKDAYGGIWGDFMPDTFHHGLSVYADVLTAEVRSFGGSKGDGSSVKQGLSHGHYEGGQPFTTAHAIEGYSGGSLSYGLREYVNAQGIVSGWFRPAMKQSIVNRITDRVSDSGFEGHGDSAVYSVKSMVNELVRGWAKSAASPSSQALQKWGGEFINDKGSYSGFADREHVFSDPVASFNRDHALPADSDFVDRFGKAVYSETQGLLEALGYEKMKLHRGTRIPYEEAGFIPASKRSEDVESMANYDPDNIGHRYRKYTVDVDGGQLDRQPLSSWTTNIDTAKAFARGHNYGHLSVVQGAFVPAASIWSTSLTGPGAFNESEFISFDTQGPVSLGYSFNTRTKDLASDMDAYLGASSPRDGDGDGRIFDGTDQEQVAVAKAQGNFGFARLLNWLPPEAPWDNEESELAKSKSANTSGNPDVPGDGTAEVMLGRPDGSELSGPYNWQSILARGYWEEVPD